MVLVVLYFVILQIFWLWYDYKRAEKIVFLQVKIPKQDSKEDRENVGEEYGSSKDFIKIASAMNQLYSSFFALYSSKKINQFFLGQDFFVCEYYVQKGHIEFLIGVPKNAIEIIEKQIGSFYPNAVIDIIPRPLIVQKGQFYSGGHIHLSNSYIFPIRPMQKMEADPINNFTNVLSKIDVDDRVGIQFLLRPDKGEWHKKGAKRAEEMSKEKEKNTGFFLFWPFLLLGKIFRILFQGTGKEDFSGKNNEPPGGGQSTPMMQERIKAVEEKTTKQGFDTVIRVLTASKTQEQADAYWTFAKAAFEQYTAPDMNSFTKSHTYSKKWVKEEYEARRFSRPFWYWTWRFIFDVHEWQQVLSTEEMSSLFHFPSIRYNPSPAIEWQEFKLTAPPVNMPKEGLLLGVNEYRNVTTEVRILPDDRMRHFYLIGKSGTGKSTILDQMIKQDLRNGKGLCLVDPHGDLVEAALLYIPRERAEDIIIFEPGDLERPMGLNILEAETEDQREFMAQEALAIFIKLYGEEIMGPRLQNYFRNAALTLMADEEDPATLIDIMRLFTDEDYQKTKVAKVVNPSVKAFWTQEYAKSGQREKEEIIPYFAAKFGPFVTNRQIRNIIGQPKSGFDFRKVMDEGKILLVNLSKGKLGDLNAKLLGMIIVSKIQMAAMSRANIPENERKDFFLYVDEFQNFVTESFASILSEARKYRLGLIIAHQYISQITKMDGGGKGSHEDTTIRDAVFGNVGSMMCFKIGAQDAETMAKEFAPAFTEQDLVNIANYHAYIKLNIKNTTSRGFVMKTIYDKTGADKEAAEAFKQLSRLKYARDRAFVEREIKRRLL